jgi:hypothetical protein
VEFDGSWLRADAPTYCAALAIMTESDQDCVNARTGQKDGQMRDECVAEELVRPGVSSSSTKSSRSFRLCISDVINLHSSGVAGCKDIPAKQFFISRPALASRTNLMRIDGLSKPQLNHRRRQYGSLVDRIGATALGAP